MDKYYKRYVIGFIVICALLLLNMCNSCNSNSNSKRVFKEIDSLRTELKINNSYINVILENIPTNTELKIEGLKSELRMIQSTDRKLLDVNRQSDIQKEIEKLEIKK